MDNWMIKIVDVGYKLEKDIYIFRKRNDNKIEMLNGDMYEYGNLGIKPTISLTNEQLTLLVSEITKQGINPIKEFTQGKLEATEKHLEDMRTLLKLN